MEVTQYSINIEWQRKKTEVSFSLFNSIGGIITTIISVSTCFFGIGWAIGS